MGSSAKCEAVAHGIRAVVGDGANMGRLNLGSAAAVDDLQAGDSAGILVSRFDGSREGGVPERTSDDSFNDGSLERSWFIGQAGKPLILDGGTFFECGGETALDNDVVFMVG